MLPHGTTRSPVERVIGLSFFVVAILVVGAAIYKFGSGAARHDAVQIAAIASVAVFAGLLCSFGLIFASSSKAGQQIGCAGFVLFGAPLLLVIAFLIWSLFQTTRGAG